MPHIEGQAGCKAAFCRSRARREPNRVARQQTRRYRPIFAQPSRQATANTRPCRRCLMPWAD